MVLDLQSTTLDINTNVEAGLKIMKWIELAFGGGWLIGHRKAL